MEDKQSKQRANSAYAFSVKDGKMVFDFPKIGVLTFDPSKVSATNRARAMNHGLKQRIVDGGAVDADKKTGKTDPREKYEEMKRVIDHLESGAEEWNLKPSVRVNVAASYVTKALIALGKYQGFDVSTSELANAFVLKIANLEKLGLGGQVGKAREWLEASSKVIREKIVEIRAAEAAATNIDADAELAALMGGDAEPEGEGDEEPSGEDELRIANAIEMFNAGAATLAEAAEEAGMTVEAFEEARKAATAAE